MSNPIPRPGLRDIDYYMVGIAKLPGFERVIKLSSNESPLGASPRAIAAAAKAVADMHRYPEVDMERLQEAIAAYFDLDPAGIAFGTGSDEMKKCSKKAFSTVSLCVLLGRQPIKELWVSGWKCFRKYR